MVGTTEEPSSSTEEPSSSLSSHQEDGEVSSSAGRNTNGNTNGDTSNGDTSRNTNGDTSRNTNGDTSAAISLVEGSSATATSSSAPGGALSSTTAGAAVATSVGASSATTSATIRSDAGEHSSSDGSSVGGASGSSVGGSLHGRSFPINGGVESSAISHGGCHHQYPPPPYQQQHPPPSSYHPYTPTSYYHQYLPPPYHQQHPPPSHCHPYAPISYYHHQFPPPPCHQSTTLSKTTGKRRSISNESEGCRPSKKKKSVELSLEQQKAVEEGTLVVQNSKLRQIDRPKGPPPTPSPTTQQLAIVFLSETQTCIDDPNWQHTLFTFDLASKQYDYYLGALKNMVLKMGYPEDAIRPPDKPQRNSVMGHMLNFKPPNVSGFEPCIEFVKEDTIRYCLENSSDLSQTSMELLKSLSITADMNMVVCKKARNVKEGEQTPQEIYQSTCEAFGGESTYWQCMVNLLEIAAMVSLYNKPAGSNVFWVCWGRNAKLLANSNQIKQQRTTFRAKDPTGNGANILLEKYHPECSLDVFSNSGGRSLYLHQPLTQFLQDKVCLATTLNAKKLCPDIFRMLKQQGHDILPFDDCQLYRGYIKRYAAFRNKSLEQARSYLQSRYGQSCKTISAGKQAAFADPVRGPIARQNISEALTEANKPGGKAWQSNRPGGAANLARIESNKPGGKADLARKEANKPGGKAWQSNQPGGKADLARKEANKPGGKAWQSNQPGGKADLSKKEANKSGGKADIARKEANKPGGAGHIARTLTHQEDLRKRLIPGGDANIVIDRYKNLLDLPALSSPDKEFVGRRVEPLDGKFPGTVVKFVARRKHFVVRYVNPENPGGRAWKLVQLSREELLSVLVHDGEDLEGDAEPEQETDAPSTAGA